MQLANMMRLYLAEVNRLNQTDPMEPDLPRPRPFVDPQPPAPTPDPLPPSPPPPPPPRPSVSEKRTQTDPSLSPTPDPDPPTPPVPVADPVPVLDGSTPFTVTLDTDSGLADIPGSAVCYVTMGPSTEVPLSTLTDENTVYATSPDFPSVITLRLVRGLDLWGVWDVRQAGTASRGTREGRRQMPGKGARPPHCTPLR